MNRYELLKQFLDLGNKGLRIQMQTGNVLVYDTEFNSWILQLSTFCERHLKDHPYYNEFSKAITQQDNKALWSYFNAIKDDTEYWNQPLSPQSIAAHENPLYSALYQTDKNISTSFGGQSKLSENAVNQIKQKVFIVHGHDDAAKQEVARTIQMLDYDPIILNEQPNGGKTIIEKIEAYTDVAFAVVLYTECDLGRQKSDSSGKERYRARQNVVFEHGYLMAKLGRNRICALVKGNVETPSDLTGVLYTTMDERGAWKAELIKNMREAGLAVDSNKVI